MRKPTEDQPAATADSTSASTSTGLGLSWSPWRVVVGFGVVSLAAGQTSAVFAVTILKVFFFDLDELEQIYRVMSVIGLGVLLLLTSYLYNRRTRRI